MGDHERIWLEPACAEDERCWCSDPLDDCAEEGCGLPATEYVRADILAARDARIAEFERILADPNAVHINMLRGTIARPSIEQVRHLYPEEFAALEAERDKLREALKAAKGYALNAVIDLQTGTKKATALDTLNGGIKRIDATLQETGHADPGL